MNEENELIICNATFSVDTSYDSDRFIKLNIKLMHDGINYNRTKFSKSNIQKSKSSIYNIPILGNVIFDKDGNPQFGSHDRHIEKDKNGNKRIIYDELPIGLIPESTKYEIKKENNVNYLYIDGYIWKGYSNYAEDIINRDKNIKLSMEILLDKYVYLAKEEVFDIQEYRYQGVTLLGNDRNPAMKNAQASIDYTQGYEEIYNNIKDLLYKELATFEKGGTQMDKEQETKGTEMTEETPVVEHEKQEENEQGTFSEDKPEKDEVHTEEVSDGKEVKDENKQEDFSSKEELHSAEFSTMKERYEIINKASKSLCANTQILYLDYYIFDFDDKYAYFDKYKDEKIDGKWHYERTKVRIGYTLSDSVCTFDGNETLMVVKLLTEQEAQDIETARNQEKQEYEELKSYKEQKLKEEREDYLKALFAKFDSKLKGHADYENLKDENEMSVKDIEEKCYSLLGRITYEASPQNTKEESKDITIGFDSQQEDIKPKYSYERILDEYYKK